MTNQRGEKINPNADLNSYYAFLWYANQDVCKRVIFDLVFKKKVELREHDAQRLFGKMNEKYQANPSYPKPYLEMREVDCKISEEHMK